MEDLKTTTVELQAGEFYYFGDYEIIVSKKLDDKYNIVIQKGQEVSSCYGLTCEQIKQVVGCVKVGFQEPQWSPEERNDGVIRHGQFDVVLELVNMEIPVYLFGPAGSGKNVLCKQIADELGLKFYFSNSVTQEYKITGFIDGAGKYHETEFYKAFTQGGLFMLDELDASAPDVLICLNAALANRYFDFPTGRVEAHPDFRVISAGNTFGRGQDNEGLYEARAVLDAATLDRFAYVEIQYDQRVEDSIANGDFEIAEFVRDIRNSAKEHRIPMVAGYRAIERLSKMSSKFTVKQSLSMAVTKGISRDDMEMLHDGLQNHKNRFAKALKELAMCL